MRLSDNLRGWMLLTVTSIYFGPIFCHFKCSCIVNCLYRSYSKPQNYQPEGTRTTEGECCLVWVAYIFLSYFLWLCDAVVCVVLSWVTMNIIAGDSNGRVSSDQRESRCRGDLCCWSFSFPTAFPPCWFLWLLFFVQFYILYCFLSCVSTYFYFFFLYPLTTRVLQFVFSTCGYYHFLFRLFFQFSKLTWYL